MQFLSVQEFSKSPQVALSNLSKSGKVVLTSKGKPTALIIHTDELLLEETLLDLRRQKAKKDLLDLQMQAQKNGTSKMSLAKINSIIKLAHQERKCKK